MQQILIGKICVSPRLCKPKVSNKKPSRGGSRYHRFKNNQTLGVKNKQVYKFHSLSFLKEGLKVINHYFDCEHVCRKLASPHQIHFHKIVLNFFYIELLIVFERILFLVHSDFYHVRISYFYLMGTYSKCLI